MIQEAFMIARETNNPHPEMDNTKIVPVTPIVDTDEVVEGLKSMIDT